MSRYILIVLNLIFLVMGCRDDDSSSTISDGDNQSREISISGTLTTADDSSTLSLEDYTVSCFSYEMESQTCTSEVSAAGAFTCGDMPADIPIACTLKSGESAVQFLLLPTVYWDMEAKTQYRSLLKKVLIWAPVQ